MRRGRTQDVLVRSPVMSSGVPEALQPVGVEDKEYVYPADHCSSKGNEAMRPQRSCPRPQGESVAKVRRAARPLGHQPTCFLIFGSTFYVMRCKEK